MKLLSLSKYNEWFGAIILITVYSSIYTLLALGVGSIATTSVLILILIHLYVAINYKYFFSFNKKSIVILWFGLLFFIPSVVNAVHEIFLSKGSLFDYSYGFFRHYFNYCLFLLGVIFAFKNSAKFLNTSLSISLSIIVFSFVANIIIPELFISIAILQERMQFENVESFGRLFGFFLQPNRASLSILSMLPLMLYSEGVRSPISIIFVILIIFALIASTGSRTGLILSAGVFIVYVVKYLFVSTKVYFRLEKRAAVFSFFTGFLFAMLISVQVGNFLLDALIEQPEYAETVMRLQDLLVGGAESVRTDDSIEARLDAQLVYLSYVLTNPFGYGDVGKSALLNSQMAKHVSHNMYLEQTFAYGWLYLLLLLFSIYYTWRSVMKPKIYILSALLFILVINGITVSGVLSTRTFILSLGLVVGIQLRHNIK